MRGRPWPFAASSVPRRNTPAYAGKTAPIYIDIGDLGKHPRVCGEDPAKMPFKDFTAETPPRMRGRRFIISPTRDHKRNTPAYAGKTLKKCPAPGRGWKHPRVCGEDLQRPPWALCQVETPPRMRGRLNLLRERGDGLGNTPAYAGKTMTVKVLTVSRRKHPRVCGEDRKGLGGPFGISETPPRMRGRLFQMPRHLCNRRNTPAYAGKTGHTGQTSG